MNREDFDLLDLTPDSNLELFTAVKVGRLAVSEKYIGQGVGRLMLIV